LNYTCILYSLFFILYSLFFILYSLFFILYIHGPLPSFFDPPLEN